MNERIKELAEQAENYAYKVASSGEDCQQAYTQKFAELIVQECTEQIKTQGISASSEGYGDYEIGFNAGLFHALYTTKKHFGVDV